ncbi:MAG: tail fiber domain-containing protein, partial [Bacteroidota bacterium]
KIAFDTNPNGFNSAGIGSCPPDDSTRLDILNYAVPMGIRIKAGQTTSMGTFRGLFATARGASPIGAELQAIGSLSSDGIVLRSTVTGASGASRGMDITVKNGNSVKGIDLKAENGTLSNDGAVVFSNSAFTANGIKIAVNGGQDATGLRVFSGVQTSSQIEEDTNTAKQNYGIYIDVKDRQGSVRTPIQATSDVGLYVTADDVTTDYAAFFDGDVGIPHELEFLDTGNGNQWAMLIEKGATANCSGQTNHSDDDLLFTYNGSLRVLFRAYDGVPCYGSDRRLKENFANLSSVLPQVLSLNPQAYNLKKDPQKMRTVGFIAQEVQALFPELVHPAADENGEELLTLNYDGFSVLAVKAIQEQQAIIEQQKTQLEKQETRLEELEKEMSEMRAWMQAQREK